MCNGKERILMEVPFDMLSLRPDEPSRAVSKRRKRAFTLVELLIVVGIIALLIALIMPSLGRARDLAKKAVCAGQMNSYGRGVMMFVQDQDTYPHMATTGGGPPFLSWPKFYGVLRAMQVEAPRKLRSPYAPGNPIVWDYSVWELDEVWDSAFCPGMDAVRLIGYSDRMLAKGPSTNLGARGSLHRTAVGYQWNFTLRAAGHKGGYFKSGRWPLELWTPTAAAQWWDNMWWMNMFIELPGGGFYVAQAIHPDELERPGHTAEAFDSWDLDSIPEINWTDSHIQTQWSWENIFPGVAGGPQSENCGGWAIFNGARHPSGPNILYADGHVAADATHEVPTNQLGSLPGSATWKGAKVVSWSNFDATFGTMGNVVPRRAFKANP